MTLGRVFTEVFSTSGDNLFHAGGHSIAREESACEGNLILRTWGGRNRDDPKASPFSSPPMGAKELGTVQKQL